MVRRILGASALALVLLACGDDAEQEGMDQALTASGIPPEPDQATADAYIATLNAINPAIVGGDSEQAIDRGRDACSAIADSSGQLSDLEVVELRFTSPDAPQGWGPGIAERILDVIREYLCPEA